MRRTLLYFFMFLLGTITAQKYNFVNYSVEDGLIQSQALGICQDKYRQLWISTEGGLSKFDGKKFTGYAKQDGLSSNRIGALMCDSAGNIWAGTEFGLSVFNGKQFRHIALGTNMVNNIGFIVEGAEGKIYATNNLKLFVYDGNKVSRVKITDQSEEVTLLYKTNTGDILVFLLNKGLFALDGNYWRKVAGIETQNKNRFFRCMHITHYGDTLFGSGAGLFKVKNGVVAPHDDPGMPQAGSILSITEDARRNLWLGTDNGAFRISREGTLHFTAQKGFTDNTVYQIYKDVENNLWFATDADGIFNFRENTFMYYDKSSGMTNPIIMGIVETREQNIYMAGYGGGLFRVDENKSIVPVELNNPLLKETKVSSLYADDQNNIWIGTLGKGVWNYSPKGGLKKIEAGEGGPSLRSGTCFLRDVQGNVLVGNPQGLFCYTKDGKINKLELNAGLVSSLKQLDSNTVIAATSGGLFMIDRSYVARKVNRKELNQTSILCLDIKGNQVWMGTTDRGLLNWDMKTDNIINYNTNSGLPSNFIYSLYVSDKQTIWTGTGFGISNLFLKENGEVLAVKNYGRAEGLLGMECNHNAVLFSSDSGLWFGTTKGLFHFNPYVHAKENVKPFVMLRSVKLFSSAITDSSLCDGFDKWFGTPRNLKLRAGQNHVTFELGGIYFTNPDAIRYKYKLEGIDTGYVTSANPVIVYASLPPGKYVFKASGITKSGIVSDNFIEYAFEIDKAFYQTGFFQFLVVLLLVSSGALVVFVTSRRKQKRKALLEQIREEEFMKLRHRTAEDFHDEIGNKLTRISILSDILKAKMEKDDDSTIKIVNQIKENTNALYAGSRDIIWSLNPQNDGLYEISNHIRDIGTALFNDTHVEFNFNNNLNSQNNRKLKLDYSRNLIMAFKEIYNNILKHSGAKKVDVDFNFTAGSELAIKVRDNGCGFNGEADLKGNGLKNIKNRVSRMNGHCEIRSQKGVGTEIDIELKNIFA